MTGLYILVSLDSTWGVQGGRFGYFLKNTLNSLSLGSPFSRCLQLGFRWSLSVPIVHLRCAHASALSGLYFNTGSAIIRALRTPYRTSTESSASTSARFIGIVVLQLPQLRHHLETNRIDCNYNNNTINNININTRAGPRLGKSKLRKSTVSISKARENKASRKSSIHTSQ